jgi:hypothetical protein
MDRDEARRIAVAHFTEGGTTNAGWTVTGPISQDVTTSEGARPALVFKFRPPNGDAWNRRSSPLSVAVDVESGRADMLR